MFNLSLEERSLLLDILEEQAPLLSVEINRTDSHEFKEGLLHRSRLLDGIIQKIKVYRTEDVQPTISEPTSVTQF